MTPNPLLKKLGYSDTDRLVIIHVDDVGMCHASVQAYKDLWEFGTITSGAVMVSCSWFLAAAEMARQNPQMDLGVHEGAHAVVHGADDGQQVGDPEARAPLCIGERTWTSSKGSK